MFKYFFLFLLFLGNLFASVVVGNVQNIDNDFAYVKINNINKNDLKLGVLIVKNIGNNSSIVARGKFIDLDGDIARFELYTFSDLKQGALPIPSITPGIGDKVILNEFIDKTLLISPNKANYEYVTSKYNNFDFISPNILAAKIYKDSQALPTRNDLRDFCKAWMVGSIMVTLKDRISLYECSSLSLITDLETNLDNKNEEKINFYSDISKNLGEKIDYFDYYVKILNKN